MIHVCGSASSPLSPPSGPHHHDDKSHSYLTSRIDHALQVSSLHPVCLLTLYITAGFAHFTQYRPLSLIPVSPIIKDGYDYFSNTFFLSLHLPKPLVFHIYTLSQASRPMSIENLKIIDPFAEAEDVHREHAHRENCIHIRIQQRNGRKTLTTVQGIPSKFSQKKILHVVKKRFACNGTTIHDGNLGDVIQLQGDQRKHMQAFLTDKKSGLELDPASIRMHGF